MYFVIWSSDRQEQFTLLELVNAQGEGNMGARYDNFFKVKEKA